MSELVVEVLCHTPYDGCWEEWHYFSAQRDDDGKITSVSPIFHRHQKAYDDYYDLTPERLTSLLSGSLGMRQGAFNYATIFPLDDVDSMSALSRTAPYLAMPALLMAFERSEYDLFRRPWFRCDNCGTSIHESADTRMSDYAGDGHGVAYLPNAILCANCCEKEVLDVDA